jgi:hypothetical protein
MTRIELEGGKYTVIHDNGADFHALRNGERWRDLVGDGLVLAMAHEIEHLSLKLADVKGWYDAAMEQSNIAGYACVDAPTTIRLLAEELAALREQVPVGYINKKDLLRLRDEVAWDGTYLSIGVDHFAQWRDDTPYEHLAPIYAAPAAKPRVVMPELPAFAEKVICELKRVEACFSDGQATDVGRHWLDLLTQLGLLIRQQRSPAMWEISQQGEDLLAILNAADQEGGQDE